MQYSVIIGPVNSGKTGIANVMADLIIYPKVVSKTEMGKFFYETNNEMIATFFQDFNIIKTNFSYINKYKNSKVLRVFVDEMHFFSENEIKLLLDCLSNTAKPMYVTFLILNLDSYGVEYPHLKPLIDQAITRYHLYGICYSCGSDDAVHSVKISPDVPDLICSKSKFVCVCQRCLPNFRVCEKKH